MLEFVDSGLYFVQDENNFINPLLQVGSGFAEKSTASGSGGPKINGSDRIRILIPAKKYLFIYIKLFQSFLIIITLNKKWLSFPTLPCADRQQVSAPAYQTDPWSQEYIFRSRYIVGIHFFAVKFIVYRPKT